MSTHSPISPSASTRWRICGRSIELSAECKTYGSNAYSNEGDVGHEYGAQWLTDGVQPPTPTLCKGCRKACTTPPCQWCGCTIVEPDEMLASVVSEYVKPIQKICLVNQIFPQVELRLESEEIKNLGGTMDALMLYWTLDDGDIAHVADFKNGTGIRVEREDNWQGMLYLLLVREHFGRHDTYRTTIAQPRYDDWDWESATYEYTDADLDHFTKAVLEAVAKNELVVGSHCGLCPAAILGKCDEFKQGMQKLTSTELTDHVILQENEHLAWVLDNADAISACLKRCYDEALCRTRSGHQIPGYKAVQGYGHRTWVGDDETTERKLRQRGLKVAECYTKKLISPAQAEKLGKKGITTGIVQKPARGIKLVPESAKGEALTFETVDQAFDSALEESDDIL